MRGFVIILALCVCAAVAFDKTKILEDLNTMKSFINKVESEVENSEGEEGPNSDGSVPVVNEPDNEEEEEESNEEASSEETTEENEEDTDEASAGAQGGPGQPCINNPGTCGKPANCRGSIVRGKCSGGSDNVCCVTGGSTPAPTPGGTTPGGAWPPAGCRPLGNFKITHYTFALEADPLYRNDPLVDAPGLPKQYKRGFLGGETGVKMQGTGLAMDGNYIRWVNGRYSYGIGGARGAPEAWKTVAVDPSVIPLNRRISIRRYADKGPLLAKDTGGAIKGNKIDYFVGPVPIAEAYRLGKFESEVCMYN